MLRPGALFRRLPGHCRRCPQIVHAVPERHVCLLRPLPDHQRSRRKAPVDIIERVGPDRVRGAATHALKRENNRLALHSQVGRLFAKRLHKVSEVAQEGLRRGRRTQLFPQHAEFDAALKQQT